MDDYLDDTSGQLSLQDYLCSACTSRLSTLKWEDKLWIHVTMLIAAILLLFTVVNVVLLGPCNTD